MPKRANFKFGAVSRRYAMLGGTAASTWLLATKGLAQGSGRIRSYEPARKLSNVDHLVVYRSNTEMVGWPHIMGYWNMGDGEILQQVTSINTRYPSGDAISHDNLGSEGLGGKSVALRSKDYGWPQVLP